MGLFQLDLFPTTDHLRGLENPLQSLQWQELTVPDKSTIFTLFHLLTKTASFF